MRRDGRGEAGGQERAPRERGRLRHTPTWWLSRWPVMLHRSRLDRLLGHQYAIIVHRGRRTGRTYETAVMVLRHDPHTGEVTVAGSRQADWLRNVRRAAPVAVFVGGQPYSRNLRFLDTDETAAALAWSRAHQRRNARVQAWFFHWPWPADRRQLHRLAGSLGGVAFGPAEVPGPSARGAQSAGVPRAGGRPGRKSDVGRIGQALRRSGIAGPLEYAFQVLHGLGHPHLLSSGATPKEAVMPLPGDSLVPDATFVRTRAHTVDAPASQVWAWVARLGAGRVGWPGWYPFERPHDPSPWVLDPRTPAAELGDVLLEVEGPESSACWHVVAIEPRSHLVLHSCRTLDTGTDVERVPGKRWADISWSFVLLAQGPGRTRLLVRTRSAISPPWYALLMRPVGLGDTVMQRELLAAIARRAEAPIGSTSTRS